MKFSRSNAQSLPHLCHDDESLQLVSLHRDEEVGSVADSWYGDGQWFLDQKNCFLGDFVETHSAQNQWSSLTDLLICSQT
jgi:hypothetical protein